MIRLAGEIADGIVLWACPASYVRDVVVPEVRAARLAAGKDPLAFDIVAAVPAAADDIGPAEAGIRAELHRYFGLPFYRTMFRTAVRRKCARWPCAPCCVWWTGWVCTWLG